MKILSVLVLFLFFSSFNAFAGSQVNYLNIDSGAVYFSLADAKSHTLPNCTNAATSNRYAISLSNETGRAIYSLLITAMASKQSITVESANDCADVAGIERAQGVSIEPSATIDSSGAGKAIYLYKGDGVTKLGRVFNTGNHQTFYYFPVDDNKQLLVYSNRQWLNFNENATLYFTQTNCAGDVHYPHSSNAPTYIKNEFFSNGTLLKKGSFLGTTSHSYLNSGGICVEHKGTNKGYNIMLPYTDPLCGNGACIFKEE